MYGETETFTLEWNQYTTYEYHSTPSFVFSVHEFCEFCTIPLVTLVVTDLGWVDMNFDIPLATQFC